MPLHHNCALSQLGISAPQGCGKTTIVEQLEELFKWRGMKAASVSIDDFYLTYKVPFACCLGCWKDLLSLTFHIADVAN